MVDFSPSALLFSALVLLIGLSFFHRRTVALFSRETRAAASLHKRAWGKRWPRHTGTIHRSDIGTLDDDDELYLDQGGDDTLVYQCLEGVGEVMASLSMSQVADVLVVLKEYNLIRSILERDGKRAFVVTGHPGIGKTTFLVYLLLHRLESKLPTAIQISNNHYLIFDKHGAHTKHINDDDPRLEHCWALSDSNQFVHYPCNVFQLKAQRVIQTTSPNPQRWKEWRKYCGGTILVVDLPKVLEIGAILKERHFDAASTLPLVGKWGPSLRTIIDIIQNPDESYCDAVSAAASTLALIQSSTYVTSNIGNIPSSMSSTIVFIRALRRSPTSIPAMAECIIPTKHLSRSFDSYSTSLTAHDALQQLRMLSPHQLIRSPDRWMHEMNMHRHLCIGRKALHLYAEEDTVELTPPDRILCASQAFLEQIPVRESLSVGDSCYWMPAGVDFPGIDGVYVDDKGDVFILQAAMAADYSEPEDGLETAWAATSQREARRWHFVLVCPTRVEANSLLDVFLLRMSGLKLGGKCSVDVWACVVRPPHFLPTIIATSETSHGRSKCYLCARCVRRLARSICSNCKAVYYCSFECQGDDWPAHKICCKGSPPTALALERPPYISPPQASAEDLRSLLESMDRWDEELFADGIDTQGLDRGFIFGTSAISWFESNEKELEYGPFWNLVRTERELLTHQVHKHNEKVKIFWVSCYAVLCRGKHWIDVILDTILNYRITHFDTYAPDGDSPWKDRVYTHILGALFSHFRDFTPSQNTALLRIVSSELWVYDGFFHLAHATRMLSHFGCPSHDFIDQLALKCLSDDVTTDELENFIDAFVLHVQAAWPQVTGTRLLDVCLIVMTPGSRHASAQMWFLEQHIIEIAKTSPTAAKHLLPVVTAICTADWTKDGVQQLLSFYEQFGVRVDKSILPWLIEQSGGETVLRARIQKLLQNERDGMTGAVLHGVDILGRLWTPAEYEAMRGVALESLGLTSIPS